MSTQRSCHNCGKQAHFLCSFCNEIYYCEKACQQNNWEQHRLICKKPQERQKKEKQTTIEYRLREYAKQSQELASQIKREETFKKIEKLGSQKMESKTYIRIVSAMLDAMFKREVQIAERLNTDTIIILRDLLETSTKATQAQISYIESELILYGKASFKLTENIEEVEKGTFAEIIEHYQNAWTTIHAILGTDPLGEPLQQEEQIMGEFISRILTKSAMLMVQSMEDPVPETVDGFIPEAWALLKHSTSNEIRKYANCIAGFAGIRKIGSLRHRKSDREAREEAEEAMEMIESLNVLSTKGAAGKAAGILHWIADGIEKNTESSNTNERLVASQILIASVFCVIAGWRYTVGYTTKQEILDMAQKRIEENLGKNEADLKKSREELQKELEKTESLRKQKEESYNKNLLDRTKYFAQLTTSHESTKSFLRGTLLEAGKDVPKSLTPDVKPAISAPDKLPKVDQRIMLPQIAAEAVKATVSKEDVIQFCPPSLPNVTQTFNAVQLSDMEIIKDKFVPFVDKLMSIAQWDLKNNPAYQEEYPSVQDVRDQKARNIETIMNRYVNSDIADRTTPSEYAAMVYALSMSYSREIELFSGQSQETQAIVFKDMITKQDGLIAALLGDLSQMDDKQKKIIQEMTATEAFIKQIKDKTTEEMNAARDSSNHVVDVFFSDLKAVIASIPAIEKAAGFTVNLLKSQIKTNLQTLFDTINASTKVLKKKASDNGITWVSWLENLGTFFTTTLRILLALNIVMYILKIVLPGLLLLLSNLLRLIQQWMAPNLNPNEFDSWFFGQFQGGPRFVRGISEAIYFAIGTARVFIEGVASGISTIGGALTVFLPALFALLGTLTNLITLCCALISLFCYTGGIASVVSAGIAFFNLIFSGIALFGYAKITSEGVGETIHCVRILFGLTRLGEYINGYTHASAWIYSKTAETLSTGVPTISSILSDPNFSLFK